MKIPFTLDAWLKDKSQKVETRDGRLVHNIWQIKEPHYTNNRRAEVCALIDGEEDALVFFEGGRYLPTTKDADNQFDLFIITPEPELSEFEQEVRVCVTKNLTTHIKDGSGCEISSTVFIDDDTAKKLAAELLEMARKELEKEEPSIIEARSYKSGLKQGKAEALKDLPRWRVADKPFYGGVFIVRKEYGGLVELSASGVVQEGSEYIVINDLEKLPGFND